MVFLGLPLVGVSPALSLSFCFNTGRYILVRDPNKPQLRLYSVPAGAPVEATGGEGSDGEGEDEDVERDE